MPQLLCICSILLLFLYSTSASPLGVVASQPPPSTYSKIPHNPVSFSPPSQHAIPHHHQPLSNEDSALHGTVKVFPSHPDQPIPVAYTISSRVCAALISELTYLMSDLSQQLLSEHIAGIPFPIPPGGQKFPLPVFLAGNITEQLYRTQYVLSLALKLTPLEETLQVVTTSHWRSIMSLLEQSAKELAQDAREGSGAGLGSVLVFQAETSGIRLHAEWKIWSIKDGVAVMCES
ncbi:hypothetical protein IFR04_009779 [Cadophora malorum]|uniref:Uncharacterized protein n=1 Tax=Cadophora malorum TaxID=108018 RepID=A0A8H7W976_9HELO|nr:hypothetical protein IFR04_009779 [Cadophora malorum]